MLSCHPGTRTGLLSIRHSYSSYRFTDRSPRLAQFKHLLELVDGAASCPRYELGDGLPGILRQACILMDDSPDTLQRIIAGGHQLSYPSLCVAKFSLPLTHIYPCAACAISIAAWTICEM